MFNLYSIKKALKEIKINSFEDILKYKRNNNREIQIDIITPQIANSVDELIRFWNSYDDIYSQSISEREPIKIFINSLGGSLDAAITIMDSIKMSKTPVYTFNIGNVYKESFLIYLAGHKRYTYPNSIFMYSNSIFTNEQNNQDSESNFYSYENINTTIKDNIKMFFLERVNITDTQYDKYSNNEWWFSADDAQKLHIANEIIINHYHFTINKK